MSNLKTISSLRAYKGTATEIHITAFDQEGFFYPYSGLQKVDGFIVIKDAAGRIWKRSYDRLKNGFFEIKGDGKVDDTANILKARDYCIENQETIYFDNGVFRYTGPWINGGLSINAADSLKYEAYNQDAPSYTGTGIQNGTRPYGIQGSQRTIFWADFPTTELTPALHYGMWGNSWDQSSTICEVGNFILCSQDGGVWEDGMFKLKNKVCENKQVGLLIQRSEGMVSFRGIQFHGFEIDLIVNSSHFHDISNIKFTNSKTGLFTLGAHSTTGSNMVAFKCGVAYEIKSGASVFNQLNTEECEQALIVGGGHNIINGAYFEKSDINTDPDKFQLQIGYNDDTYPVRGTIINGMTIAAPNGGGVLLNKTAREVTINGSMFVSAGTKLTSDQNTLFIENSYTDTPRGMPGKIFKDGNLISE